MAVLSAGWGERLEHIIGRRTDTVNWSRNRAVGRGPVVHGVGSEIGIAPGIAEVGATVSDDGAGAAGGCAGSAGAAGGGGQRPLRRR